MFILTRYNQEYGESQILVAGRNVSDLERFAENHFQTERAGSECDTERLCWFWENQEEREQAAHVDWGWGDPEVYRIQKLKVLDL